MARRDEEGFFYIVDRMKDMIITGGENVYSREVEEVVYTHPSVSEAAVIGLPDPAWGETVTAVVVLREGTTATERRHHRGLRRPAGRLQEAEAGPLRGRAAQERQREDPQARAARPFGPRGLTGGPRLACIRLDGKVGVVTGASYGLGVLFAEMLASAGADVVVTARCVDKLERRADGREASAGAASWSPATSPSMTTASGSPRRRWTRSGASTSLSTTPVGPTTG